MAAVLSLLVVLVVIFLVTRVATVALTMTGVSEEVARFQARSAFTGTGFTTREAEMVVSHPVRRRIVQTLMLLGNAGFVGAAATLFLSFVDVPDRRQFWIRAAVLGVGLVALVAAAYSRWLERRLRRVIERALEVLTDLEVRDYESLLRLGEGYTIAEMVVPEGHWLAERSLADLHLTAEGVTVLGIQRAGRHYLGTPRGDTRILPGDVLVLYGHADTIRDLDQRRRGAEGDRSHARAVAQERLRLARQEREDAERAEPESE